MPEQDTWPKQDAFKIPWGKCVCGYEGPNDCHRPPQGSRFAGSLGYCTSTMWFATRGESVGSHEVKEVSLAGFHEHQGKWHKKGWRPVLFSEALASARGLAGPFPWGESSERKQVMSLRASWDEYFMRIAHEVSTRATCSRRSVGCVLVRDKRILATGYNGSIRGLAHCTDVGCLMEDEHCVRTVHAESNAVVQAAQSLEGACAYVTSLPCWVCFKLLANAGVKRIVFRDDYPNNKILTFAMQAGIQLEKFETTEVPIL